MIHMNKITARIAMTALIFVALPILFARPSFSADDAKDSAKLERIEGAALIRPAGAVLWRPAVEGEPVAPGDRVRTRMKSSVFVVYPGGGSAKLMPLTEIIIDRVTRKGLNSSVLGIESGRALIQMDLKDADSQIVVKAGQTAFRGRHANVFVESAANGSCVDVIKGAVSLISTIDATQNFNVESGYRAVALNDTALLDSTPFNITQEELALDTYTCMTAPQKPIEPIASVVPADSAPDNAALSDATAAPDDQSSGDQSASEDEDAKEDSEESDGEEIEITITSTTTATFNITETAPTASAGEEGETVCKTPPRMLKASANEITIMPGSRMAVEFIECGNMEVMLSGSAEDGCGPVEKVLIKIDDNEDETYKAEGTKKWSYTATFEQQGLHTFAVWIVDKTGAVSDELEFKLDLEKTVEPPTVTLDSIANRTAPAFGGYMKLNKSRLTDGKMRLAGTAESDRCDISKAEVSMNDGATWVKAEGRNSWSYSFAPREGTYEFAARSVDADKQESLVSQTVEVNYIDKTDEELLRIDFDALMRAYRDKDSGTFVDGASSMFSSSGSTVEDKSRLDQSLNSKFNEQTSVYLRYQVSSIIVSGNTGRVMFSWDANKITSGYSHTGNFVFNMEEEGWKLLTVEDSATFLRHTDEAAFIAVSASEPQLKANNSDTSIISIEVRDSAYNPVKDGTIILLSANTGAIDSTVTTQEGLAQATYTSGSSTGTAIITANRNGVSGSVSITIVEESPPGPPAEP
ncbi:MAG: invasin domain 3-containing protein [bacterium]